jgi:hypothetical protein
VRPCGECSGDRRCTLATRIVPIEHQQHLIEKAFQEIRLMARQGRAHEGDDGITGLMDGDRVEKAFKRRSPSSLCGLFTVLSTGISCRHPAAARTADGVSSLLGGLDSRRHKGVKRAACLPGSPRNSLTQSGSVLHQVPGAVPKSAKTLIFSRASSNREGSSLNSRGEDSR